VGSSPLAAGCRVATVGQLHFASWAWAYSTLHPLGSVNEFGYSWEGIRQVRAMLLGARHVPEHLCGGYVYFGGYIKCSTFTFFTFKRTVDNVDLTLCLSRHNQIQLLLVYWVIDNASHTCYLSLYVDTNCTLAMLV